MAEIIGLQITPQDNVATVFSTETRAGETVAVTTRTGRVCPLTALTAIPYGHKIAVTDIEEGDAIVKYGEVIGRASAGIRAGEHVHVHNMESCRGRGDLEETP